METGSAYEEEELLPLSGLQHLIFCDRQAALIHVDGTWVDNAFTIEGRGLHQKVDSMQPEVREGVLVHRSVALRSLRLGLIGKSDVVEFRSAGPSEHGTLLEGQSGTWMPNPVEYKRGRPKMHRADEVQLCAQGLCLEEQFGVSIPGGQLFYGRTRRRQAVAFSSELRQLTEETAARFHDLVRRREIPVHFRKAKCERCSLISVCLPPGRKQPPSASVYLAQVIGTLPTEDSAQ